MRFTPPGLPDPTETACQPPAITPPQENGGNDDLRNAGLSLYPGPAAGAVEALRDHHVENLGEARHPAGRIFHDSGRRIPSGTDVSAGVGIARRPREEMDRISERPRMDRGACENRGRRPDCRQHRQSTAGADRILGGEVAGLFVVPPVVACRASLAFETVKTG